MNPCLFSKLRGWYTIMVFYSLGMRLVYNTGSMSSLSEIGGSISSLSKVSVPL